MPLNLRLKPQGFSPGPKGQPAQVSLQGHKCPCSLRKAARMSIARMIGVWRSSNAIPLPAQASAVARLPLKSIHKLIDGRLIRPIRSRAGQKVQRFLTEDQVIYLRLEAEGVRLLPLATRRKVARAIEASPSSDSVSVAEGPALVVQVKAARQQVARDLQRLRKAEEMIVCDPEIMRGTPVYRGTRIPVELVAAMLEQGTNASEIVAGYPALDREKIELAPLYLRAFPRRGRPAQRPWASQTPIRTSTHPAAPVTEP